ncbi:MAG: TIGR02677 family protein [Clostridia bacterium]|nr:TIGR02677 family protein [Clostridia bacterium]
MKEKLFKPLKETKYLSAENAWRYRGIMRYFFEMDQKYRHWLSKEDVFNTLIRDSNFEDYTLDLCKQDLDMLTEWGNLSTKQDTSKVVSYQQFVNKQFQYQMTEYAIEIERMTMRLENLLFESGSLEPTLLERIKYEIQRIPEMTDAEEKIVGGWWSQLKNDFQRLNKNYQDYIRDWNSIKAEEMMQTQGFLMYKEKLVDYLRHFVQELQHHGVVIERSLKAFDNDEIDLIFEKITNFELSIPKLELKQVNREEIYAFEKDKFNSIKRFFMNQNAENSEIENILSMTNDIIRKIARFAVNLLEMTTQYSSRKEDYQKIATLFSEMEDISEAHKLSSQVFGISSYLHIVGELNRETESINSSIYHEKPMTMVLTPRVRTFRERIHKTAIIDHQEEKEKMRQKVLDERKAEEEVLMMYLKENIVAFENLSIIPETVRRTFLRWLVKGIHEEGKTTVTEHGIRYHVVNPKETRRCFLECEDGIFEMPAFILKFEEN